jgi:hypothetical protein
MIVVSHWFRTNNLYGKNLVSYHCATRVSKIRCRISDIKQKFIPISYIMSDSAHFSPISDIPISGSVRYRWSRISDWVPTYAKRNMNDVISICYHKMVLFQKSLLYHFMMVIKTMLLQNLFQIIKDIFSLLCRRHYNINLICFSSVYI